MSAVYFRLQLVSLCVSLAVPIASIGCATQNESTQSDKSTTESPNYLYCSQSVTSICLSGWTCPSRAARDARLESANQLWEEVQGSEDKHPAPAIGELTAVLRWNNGAEAPSSVDLILGYRGNGPASMGTRTVHALAYSENTEAVSQDYWFTHLSLDGVRERQPVIVRNGDWTESGPNDYSRENLMAKGIVFQVGAEAGPIPRADVYYSPSSCRR